MQEENEKKKTPAAAWVTILGTRKRIRYGYIECGLLTIAGTAKFMENPDQWHHFLDIPMWIHNLHAT